MKDSLRSRIGFALGASLALAAPLTSTACRTPSTPRALDRTAASVDDVVPGVRPLAVTPDLELEAASVRYDAGLDLLVFELDVAGRAGSTVPTAAGQLDGAPVLGYVFPTTLAPIDVGFRGVEGSVALAVTSHPDFDDTPLWDEDADRDWGNDGVVYHPHWVVLTTDERVPGGLSVAPLPADGDPAQLLPPTNPGMPMYMDSPGFSVVLRGDRLRVLVPAVRVANRTDFRFDGVTAYMQVMKREGLPLLGVYEVYDVLSGDLSLPFEVERTPR